VRLRQVLAIGAIAASATAALVGMLLIAAVPPEIVPVGYRLVEMMPFLALQIAFTAVGALLVVRRPENLIGTLLCGTSLVSAMLVLMAGVVANAIATGDTRTASLAAWGSECLTLAVAATFGPALLLFPDGRLGSRAARVALLLLIPTVVASVIAVAFRPLPLSTYPGIVNPYGWSDQGPALSALLGLGMGAGLLAIILGVASQVARFRHSSGVERQQFKWFLTSAVVVTVALVPALALMYGEGPWLSTSAQRYAGRAIGGLSITAVPVAIGVAILRYRLYDIDLLIRRTLVYAGVSAFLVATYTVAVVLTGAALRPFTAGSDLAVAASTLVVVALFQPLRQRVRDFVDRHFYRSRYDSVRTLDAFGARLRNEVDLDSVRADLLGVIGTTLRPAHASVWLRPPHR
jgi:hypothetical protein